jgi:hypothetical protein
VHWLKADQVPELRKDAELFPQFDAHVAVDLRTSFELFLEEALADEKCDFRRLLLADDVHLNKRLAPLYGAEVKSDTQFERVKLSGGERAGVLTHPYLMAVFADSTSSSPVRRGVFIARSLLGRVLRPPPDAVTPLIPSLHPDLTTRQRVALQTGAESCQTCHATINPLGFALEGFDALGVVRSTDNGKSIDTSGGYLTRTGESLSFDNARSLAVFLAGSDEVHTAFIEKLFYYSAKHPVAACGPETLAKLKRKFANHDFSVRNLLAEIGTFAAMAGTPHPSAAPPAASPQ